VSSSFPDFRMLVVMQTIITAVGPDNRGLADPIVHCVTELGANISEIQMFDHDEESLFSMLTRVDLDPANVSSLRDACQEISKRTGLAIRTWSPEIQGRKPRLAICCTYRPETPRAVLEAIGEGIIGGEATVMISNREACRHLAEHYDVPWYIIGDNSGKADDDRFIAICDEYQVDYIVLARYMRILPPSSVWQYAGGRIINLHHGLLPSFPGMRPYHEAFTVRMLMPATKSSASARFPLPPVPVARKSSSAAKAKMSQLVWLRGSVVWWPGKCNCTSIGWCRLDEFCGESLAIRHSHC